jgi:hypothetical protein
MNNGTMNKGGPTFHCEYSWQAECHSQAWGNNDMYQEASR